MIQPGSSIRCREFNVVLNAAVLLLASVCGNAQDWTRPLISQDRFELVSRDSGFVLRQSADASTIPIPIDWLIPSAAQEEEDGNIVSSFVYGERVSSFAIGRGKSGIHLSSFDTQTEGSAQLVAGRDVFLVFDEATQDLQPGILDLGVTTTRSRSTGCVSATATKFLLSDLNNDGSLDVGVMSERLSCREVVRDDIDGVDGPYYELQPTRWYLFAGNGWSYDASFDGRFPHAQYWRLPLINMVKTPVDFVMDLSKRPG